jgi:hypothetical protein
MHVDMLPAVCPDDREHLAGESAAGQDEKPLAHRVASRAPTAVFAAATDMAGAAQSRC